MKKFISLLLTLTMLFSVASVPALAADLEKLNDEIVKITDDFEDGYDTSVWRKDYSEVKQKVNASNSANHAAWLKKDTSVSPAVNKNLQNYNHDGKDYLSDMKLVDRALFEFDFLAESCTASGFNFFKYWVTNADGASKEGANLLHYGNNELNVIGYSTASAQVSLGTWCNILVDADIENGVFSVYVDGVRLSTDDGKDKFEWTHGGSGKGSYAWMAKIEPNANAEAYVDNISWRQSVFPANDGTYFTIASGTVNDGDTEVDTNPVLSYTFNHEVKADTAKYLSINGDESYINSAAFDGDTLNVTLSKELDYNTEYTLSFGMLEDANGSLLSHDITFKTKSDYNLIVENFDDNSYIDTALNTAGAYNGGSVNEYKIATAPDSTYTGNKAFYMNVENKGSNTYLSTDSKFSVPEKAVINFSLYIDEATTTGAMNFLDITSKNSEGTSVKNPSMLYFYNPVNGEKEIKVRTKDGYVSTGFTYNKGEWVDISLYIEASKDNFHIAINGVECENEFTLYKSTNKAEIISAVSFTCNTPLSILYIDNVVIGQSFFANPKADYGFYNASGTKIDELNSEDTIFKAQLINRGLTDEKVKLYIAGYGKTSHTLDDLIAKEYTIKAGKALKIEEHIKNLGGLSYTRSYKAFFAEGADGVTPFDADSLMTRCEIAPGTSVVKAYPNGKLKALSFSFDDGKKGEEALVNSLNSYNMKGTFNIVGSRADGGDTQYTIQKADLASVYAGHELGNHSYTHSHSSKDNPYTDISQFEEELTKADAVIKDATGSSAVGYVYDGGYIPEALKDEIASVFKKYGYIYGRDNGVTGNFDLPEISELPFLNMTASIGTHDYDEMSALADTYLELNQNKMSLFTIWGHNMDFTEANGWDTTYTKWNSFLQKIANKEDIWYATNADIYSYILAMDKLSFTEDAIYNSSDISLWCLVGGNPVEIPSGDGYSLETHEILLDAAPVTIEISLAGDEKISAVYPGGKYKAVTMRFDDATLSDKDLVPILNEYDLKASFAVIAYSLENTGNYYISGEELKEVYAGHEVVNHSYDHDHTNITKENLEKSLELIKKYWDEDVIGYVAPSGNWTASIDAATYKQYLKDLGHIYATNDSNSENAPTDIATLINFKDPFDCKYSVRMVSEGFMDKVSAYVESEPSEQTLFFPFAHAKDFKASVTNGDGTTTNKYDVDVMRKSIKEFAELVANKNDIWYATNGDVITYLMAQNTLNIPSSGSSTTVNTTDKTVYYLVGDKLVTLAPGSTLIINAQ